jgi:protein involved in polysaccharide export with SLBB domain
MMMRRRRLRPRPIGRQRTGAGMRRGALDAAVLPIVISLLLTCCQQAPSFERESNGTTVYLDKLSQSAKAAARAKVEQALSRGVSTYRLGVGDEFDVLFQVNYRATPQRYTIAPGDKLQVQILGDTENSGTVEVLPDGRVFLPLLGGVRAAGKTVDALSREIQERYSKMLIAPKVTVNVSTSHSALADFLATVGSSAKGRVVAEKVLPDGTVALPLLAPRLARGLTLQEFAAAADAAYAAKGITVSVSLVPRTLLANSVLVIGEVGKPGRISLKGPTTVAMAVAQAGGVPTGGAADAVHVFYIGPDGNPRVRSINLNEVMDDFKLEDDMIVPRNSIIYVPPTALARTGRFMSAIMRDILRFQGFSIGGAYSIQ